MEGLVVDDDGEIGMILELVAVICFANTHNAHYSTPPTKLLSQGAVA
jgi:hypothetical protein